MNIKSFLTCTGLLLISTMSVTIAADVHQIDGVWASEGYGRVLEIKDNNLRIFGVTKVSCVLRENQSLDEFLLRINRINLSENNKLSYYEEGGITRYDFARLEKLSAACVEAKNEKLNPDPEHNFEVFWHSFSENYAFFDTHNVDWNAVYEEYRPTITAKSSNEELYEVLTEMIKLLDDRHVSLQGEGLPNRYSGHPGTLAKLLQNELPEGEEATREKFMAVAKSVVAEHYLKTSRKEAVDGQFTWGWATDGIGYFSIDSMADYVDEDTRTLRESHRLVDVTMDEVIRDLEDATGFIVDARWNGGGYDSNALHIAGHFTDQQLLAFTKRARKGDTLTPEQEIFIPWHALERFPGPVIYLCDRDTLSAAEIFSLAMMAMPNVTTLGEPTVGALSDTHSVHLPNGWRLRLSNEVYKAIDGVVYEAAGIPVDIYLPAEKNSSLESYIRLGMDEAIALLQQE